MHIGGGAGFEFKSRNKNGVAILTCKGCATFLRGYVGTSNSTFPYFRSKDTCFPDNDFRNIEYIQRPMFILLWMLVRHSLEFAQVFARMLIVYAKYCLLQSVISNFKVISIVA